MTASALKLGIVIAATCVNDINLNDFTDINSSIGDYKLSTCPKSSATDTMNQVSDPSLNSSGKAEELKICKETKQESNDSVVVIPRKVSLIEIEEPYASTSKYLRCHSVTNGN